MHRSAKFIGAGLGITFALAAVAAAEDDGDKNLGRAVAEAKCAECHAIEPGANSSPDAAAPPFSKFITSEKLSISEIEGWLTSSHKNMPAVTVPPEARANLVAYIKSLALTK